MLTSQRILSRITLLGPGLLVMLADTDAGSLILSAQSGAVWGYRLLLLQIILMPVLFIAQELSVRLGLVTGKGLCELIKQYFGNTWAWIAIITLVICCVGALLTELSGLVAVGELFGITAWQTLLFVISLLILMIWTGTYHSIEKIGIFVGGFEIIFIFLAWRAQAFDIAMLPSMLDIPWQNSSYLFLAAGNIGAIIMPWMIFFQQSAIVDKGLSHEHLTAARWDTAVGALLTQLIMSSLLILAAATIGKTHSQTPLHSINEISHAMQPMLGSFYSVTLFALGIAGAAIVATIVVSLTAAWGIGEMMGFRHSINKNAKSSRWFYGSYTFLLITCGLLIFSNIKHLVILSVCIQVMNAFLLPLVLALLFLLARRALPATYALKGWYAMFVGIILTLTSVFAVFGGIVGMM